MSLVSDYRQIQILPGVETNEDNTSFLTQHYTFADHVRFVGGLPQKTGGRQPVSYSGATLSGYARTYLGANLGAVPYGIIGTNSKLFSLFNSGLSDITPAGLADGPVNESATQGYGAGRYGVGRYGTTLPSLSTRVFPRIWSLDKFGGMIIAAPGSQQGVYSWAGDPAVLPALVANAPTAINYAFVSDNILVTLGADGVPYRIRASDLNNITQWTSSSTNQVYSKDENGIGQWISHASIFGKNLLFSKQKTYTFRYIGGQAVWELKELNSAVGIIAQNARVTVDGVAYWMHDSNFYMSDGSSVKIIPSNSKDESTILRYVFDNLNYSQKSKCFAWYNKQFKEVWFHYPRGSSLEPNAIARVSLHDYSWTPDTSDIITSEYPVAVTSYPRTVTPTPTMYYLEIGTDDGANPLPFTLSTRDFDGGKRVQALQAIIPDSLQVGDIIVTVSAKLYPQSSQLVYQQDYTVSPQTERVPLIASGRYWNWTISGNSLGQSWRCGNWIEDLQPSGNN